MLFNPKWKVKPSLTFTRFVAWLEKQPADTTYDWYSCAECLVARYIQDVTSCRKEDATWQVRFHSLFASHDDYCFVGRGSILDKGKPEDWTYGAALERARSLMEKA